MDAKPFLKWAGGKHKLLPQISNYLPDAMYQGKITTYVEAFVGGGALFFYLRQRFDFKESVLIDINPDLILAYRVIRDKREALSQLLKEYHLQYHKFNMIERSDWFYKIRDNYNNDERYAGNETVLDENHILRVAMLIALNKTCYNGLYRLNSKGLFNAPYGKYKTASIYDSTNLSACSCALSGVTLITGDYSRARSYLTDKTFVYFDPPYKPVTNTSSFTSYAGNTFGDQQQRELAKFFEQDVTESGAYAMLSNSDPLFFDEQNDFFECQYHKSNINRVMAARAINSKAEKRGKIPELLITNYGEEERRKANVQQTLGFNL